MIEGSEVSNAEAALKKHPFLASARSGRLNKAEVELLLGQWFHPLHYFPTFISRHISVCSSIPEKTYVSKIMWQELGEGDPARSHETLFVETMSDAGFDRSRIVDAEPLPATRALIETYSAVADDSYAASLGSLFATEAADLAMVGAVGAAVRKLTQTKRLPWVDIHVQQEPDHTSSVGLALDEHLSDAERLVVERAATRMFGLWSAFYSEIEAACAVALHDQRTPAPA